MPLDFSTLIFFYQENFFIKVKPTIENKLARHEMSFRTYLPLSIFLPLLLSLSLPPLSVSSLCHCHPFPWSSLSLFWSSTDLLKPALNFSATNSRPAGLWHLWPDFRDDVGYEAFQIQLSNYFWVLLQISPWCPPFKKNWWTHLQQLVLETNDYKLAPWDWSRLVSFQLWTKLWIFFMAAGCRHGQAV